MLYDWFLLLYYKMTKTGNKLEKAKRFFCFLCFLFYRTYAAHLLNQHRQLTNGREVGECLRCYFFFDFKSPLNALFLKTGATKTTDYTFDQTSYFPLSLTPIRTLLMESNLKKSTILFVLCYLRYKGRLMSQIWDSKVYSWLHRQVDHQLHCQMDRFLQLISESETAGALSTAS